MNPTTIDAVFQGGVFRPTNPVELPEGTAVRLSVTPGTAATPTPGRAAFDMIRAIAGLPDDPGTDPAVTSRNVDQVLYGGPGGAR